MKQLTKKVISYVICFTVVFHMIGLIPTLNGNEVSAAGLTLSQLQSKFPAGKYWNHAGSSSNNPNGYTSTPCTHHGGCSYYGNCGCNSFSNAIQCMGFAYKLGYDAYGTDPRNWSTVKNLNSLKAGDVIRYKNNGHSIFVTGVSGDTIYFADCNSDGHCKIRWGQTISKSTVRSSLTNVRIAPWELGCDDPILPGIIDNSYDVPRNVTADHKINTYDVYGNVESNRYIASGDNCYIEAVYTNGFVKIEYPTSSGKRWSYAKKDDFYIPLKGYAPTGYSIEVSSTSMYIGEQIQIYITPYDNNVTGYKFYALKPDGTTASKDLGGSNGANFNPSTSGTYKIYAAVYNNYGEYKGSVTDGCVTVNVMEKESPSLTFSATTVNLDLAGTNSATVNITAKGNLPSSYHFSCSRDTSVMSTKWGDWSGNSSPLTINGLQTGEYTIDVSLIDSDTVQKIYIDTIYVNITCSHNYSTKVISPTVTEKGYTLHTCSKCGHSYKDNYTEFEFTASASSLSINGFESKNVTFSYKNYSGKVTITWDHGEDRATTLTWGEWSNNTVALNIAGYAKGTEKIKVSLKDTDSGKVLASKTITVTVTGIETKLNATSTSLSIDMSKNEKKSVTFSYENVPAATKSMNIRWVHENDRATTLEWSGWENHTDTLYITGYKPGTESIKIEFYDSDTEEILATKTIKVTVTCSHKYTTKIVSPTCTEKGYTTHTCSICNNSYKDTYVDAKGHSMGSWAVTKEATCTEDGHRSKKCSNCNFVQMETISKGHKYNDTIISPTHLKKGYTNHVCAKCNYTFNDTYVQYTEKVVVADAVLMQKYLVKQEKLDSDQFKQADMNNDGKLNVFDVIIMKRKIINPFYGIINDGFINIPVVLF